MIFPSEALLETRRNLLARLEVGEITQEEAFREALNADPEDFTAIRFFAGAALEAGDLDGAESYARHLIRLHPGDSAGYTLLSEVLRKRDPDSPLASAYANAPEHTTPSADEPENVTRELEPYRLVAHIYDEVMEPETVDTILRQREACGPLLIGVLREWADEQLDEDEWTVVERALALLGEIGDPATIPAILEFLTDSNDDISGPAEWAFQRLAWQRPEETLAVIVARIPEADETERFALSQQIALMPDLPGRLDALTSLLEGIAAFPDNEQKALVTGVMAGVMMLEGRDSPLASSLEKKHGKLSRESRAAINDLRRELPEGPLVPTPPELTIYQICCEAPSCDHDDHDHAHGPLVRDMPKLGRNDPCWCGSGKKYKKCHLDTDEGR
jgi:SEC-C motif